MSNWTDTIIGQRMAVDQEFNDRVRASQFTNSEWELIMTATDLEMEHAADPGKATIVANTDDVAAIIPELAAIRSQTAGMAGQPINEGQDSGGGLLDSLTSALGLGGDNADEDAVDEAKLAAAEQLAGEYAEALQAHLETTDSFEQARTAYLDSQVDGQ